MRWVRRVLVGIVLLAVVLAAAVRLTTFHPAEVASETVSCATDAPVLEAGQSVTVMNWNVQYMAGKGYVFWYDLLDESGPDEGQVVIVGGQPLGDPQARRVDLVLVVVLMMRGMSTRLHHEVPHGEVRSPVIAADHDLHAGVLDTGHVDRGGGGRIGLSNEHGWFLRLE